MQKSIWILGVLAGLGCAFLEYLYFGSTSGDPRVMFLAKAVILAVFLIFGLILIRKLNGGVISLGRTILSGVLISLIRAVVMILVFLSLYISHIQTFHPTYFLFFFCRFFLLEAGRLIILDCKKNKLPRYIKRRLHSHLK